MNILVDDTSPAINSEPYVELIISRLINHISTNEATCRHVASVLAPGWRQLTHIVINRCTPSCILLQVCMS